MSKFQKEFCATDQGKKSKVRAAIASTKSKALKCGNMLMFLGHTIDKDLWDGHKTLLGKNGCKKTVTSQTIDKYWEGNWTKFEEDCTFYNHKVVEVIEVDVEDVYNLTVDDNHTYCVVTKIGESSTTKRKTWSGVAIFNCSEIILRNRQFCNLSEVVIRDSDTFDSLKEKVRLATILGTMQTTLTNFRYLGALWGKNTKEESLLGVSLTGILDNRFMACRANSDEKRKFFGEGDMFSVEEVLVKLKDIAIAVNKEWAEKLGVNQSVAITCVKPSGTVSQLVDSSSGIHPRYSIYYIRTVRSDKKDPLAKLMADSGVPCEDDRSKPDHNYVFSFPMNSHKKSISRDEFNAIEQLELWLVYQRHWCEHKPSITVYVKESGWLEVGAWVYKHFDEISGISFLPHTDHIYPQAPYQEIEKEEYTERVSSMPVVDWNTLVNYEKEDNTTGTHEFACTAGACELT